MKITKTFLPDVLLLVPLVYGDQRGFFMETYRELELLESGIDCHFVQDNHSGSSKGVLRGLHYQIKQPQGKLIRVVQGEVFDVAVDIRKNSPTFGKWVSEVLSAENRRQLWIPAGFAHGFYVISDWAEILYKATDYYFPEGERTLIWNDPAIGIKWPFSETNLPILSIKDLNGQPLSKAETF